MKHGWEYKQIMDVGKVVTGSTPPTSDKQNYTSNDVCFVKPSDIGQDGITDIQETEFHISEYAYNNTNRKLPKGSVLVTCIGIIGKVGILTKEATCNQQINAVIPNSTIMPRYLAYCIYSIRKALQDKANAPVVPILNKGQFSSFQIPVPPLPVQQQICSLLDKLSRVIEAKKEQLKELDNLAQSIFYDMFGDPITNDKGWGVKRFDQVGELQRGGGFLKSDFVVNGVPCIHYGQIHMKFGRFIKRHLTEIPESVAAKSKTAKKGDVILAITSEDVEGSCKCTAWMGDYDVYVGAHTAIFKHNLDPIYVSYYIMSSGFQRDKERYVHGIKVMEIKPSDIGTINILVPPLPLQQSFAEKVEAIERQKELINQSIREVQTLFDSRMDYWFSD